ncbi:hypothetical protein PAPYR_7851 [Paratrimastix pyriformis]|uniref:Uncharacterized protein n=1 Tax=Paratrimastix pyriformis TaxID=342808 RepID=A0ABQ8UGK6_9EUKA|nr:hypothetical protein PAPYR_7851 [Paratrimastix pyriformis]
MDNRKPRHEVWLPSLFYITFFRMAHQCTQFAKNPPAADFDLWMRLPPELLRTIVEASPNTLYAYIQLLSLSHAIRAGIRGTLREMSFIASTSALSDLAPDADALVALVGPCKTLVKLAFPTPQKWGAVGKCGDVTEEAASANWVDEAFGGHTQLAVLTNFPSPSDDDVVRMLGHLPGLVELTVSPSRCVSALMLATLARSCPRLQVLQCTVSPDFAQTDPAALAQLASSLERLALWGPRPEQVGPLVGRLSAVTSLKLVQCPPAALEPIASHLTALKLRRCLREGDLPGPWLNRLEALSLDMTSGPFSPRLASLLAANQHTLGRLSLKLLLEPTAAPLVATSLGALPHLTRLRLSVQGPGSLAALVPPELADRLVRLRIELDTAADPTPMRIASRSLQSLRLTVERDDGRRRAVGSGRAGEETYRGRLSVAAAARDVERLPGLALHCPALVDLEMAHCRIASLQCPRLRTITAPAQSLEGAAPLPDLEAIGSRWWWRMDDTFWADPAWLLAGSPRLRVLSRVSLTQPDLMARLCASPSLVRLEELYLDVSRLPNPLVMQLPRQLEHLDLRLEGPDRRPSLLDLHLEAPGLRDLQLGIPDSSFLPSVRVLLRNCPSLAHIWFKKTFASLSLEADETFQPRCLYIEEGLEPACLLGLLTRHGAHLHALSLQRGGLRASAIWPALMEALAGLPRLSSLVLEASGGSSPLSLACPHLRELLLRGLPGEFKVVLACPLLERLLGIRHPSSQLELALPTPNLNLSAMA